MTHIKNIILDYEKLTDSKEYYQSRPSKALPAFLYCIILIFLVALIYSFAGKIDIVATASGNIRPNEQISTVASLVSGRITNVSFRDGQHIQKGDLLFSVDDIEFELKLSQIYEQLEKLTIESEMYKKYAESIRIGENLFSSNTDSVEYDFFIQFEKYALSLKESELNTAYEESKVDENIATLSEQVEVLEKQINGLVLLRASIVDGNNQVSNLPEYSIQYLAYESSLQRLKDEYEAQRRSIELDTNDSKTGNLLSEYRSQLNGYTLLLKSIQQGKNLFAHNDNSLYHSLYSGYLSQLQQYEAAYAISLEKYNFLKAGGSGGDYYRDMLKYQQTMLEGYTLFKNSVITGTDQFNSASASYSYRSLYLQYKTEYDRLDAKYITALGAYEIHIDNGTTGIELETAKMLAESILSDRENFKTTALAEIDNTIFQINAAIAEININIGSGSQAYQIETARLEMEAASSAITSYVNQKKSEYQDIISQLNISISEIEISQSSTLPKSERLALLDNTYQRSIKDSQLNMLTQVDTSLRSSDNQLISAKSSLRLNILAKEMYANARINNPYTTDESINISYIQISSLAAALDTMDSLDRAIIELQDSISQTQQFGEQCFTYASVDGIVNMAQNITIGDIVSAGPMVATIVPANETEYKVQLLIRNEDIANIEIGATIRYNIAAIPSRQYGTISGVVTYVGADTIVYDDLQPGYYLVEGTIDKTAFVDKDGNEVSIGSGMAVEARIVLQQKSIINYLLEKINLS